jgi:hypothetical protein
LRQIIFPEYSHDRVTRELMSLFATKDPGRDMVDTVADSSDPSRKYFHHLLLRFLVFLSHDDMEKNICPDRRTGSPNKSIGELFP